jgi:predicted DCC family thiol-disulfide oxidoreductase YuxK
MADQPAVLLFDGTCGFCARSVQFILGRERRRRTLHFASLQSSVGSEVKRHHPELETIDSVIWYEPGDAGGDAQLLVRSAAVLRVLHYLGGGWSVLARLGAIVPAVVRDWLYDFVARHRHQIIRGGPACLLPTAEQRARFIEWESAA